MILRAIYPYSCNDDFASHLPFSLVRHLSQTELHAELWVTGRGPRARQKYVRAVLPDHARSLFLRLSRAVRLQARWEQQLLERYYLRAFQQGDAALVSRGCSQALMQALRNKGHAVFLERVNTMDHTAKRILEQAFERAGWEVDHSYTQDGLDGEQAQAELADFIFSASPAVTESLTERGIPGEKILECSYGWEPERFGGTTRALPAIEGVTVLFVGSIGMRKGAHLLLRAWSNSGIKGRLVLLGHMEPLLRRHCSDLLQRRDVVHLPYDPAPGPVYRSADIFVLPTLEEGSPLVGYEAMGNSLPVVISPMGAGRVVRHRREGLVVDPYDEAGWIQALRHLAGDAEARQALGAAARIRAEEYTWDKVARRRYELIVRALTAAAIHR